MMPTMTSLPSSAFVLDERLMQHVVDGLRAAFEAARSTMRSSSLSSSSGSEMLMRLTGRLSACRDALSALPSARTGGCSARLPTD